MKTFSFGGAVGSGVGVIARNPLAFLVWCAVYLVVALGPLALMAAAMWPQFSALAALAEAEIAPDSPAATRQMTTLMGQVNALSLLQWVTSLASSALIMNRARRITCRRCRTSSAASKHEAWPIRPATGM